MTRMTQEEAFAQLERRGATRAVVEFSGGNDEGGADSITLYTDEEEIAQLDEAIPAYLWDEAQKAYIPHEPTEDEELDARLAETLEAPVYDEYSGFAGDFSVEGAVVWNVETKTVSMEGSESQYVPFEKVL